ncbi:MAG TPA: hypothetical protein VIT41_12520 [Microlunatus sp.]
MPPPLPPAEEVGDPEPWTSLRAIGVEPQLGYGPLSLGVPDLLVSRRRAAIIDQRDRLLAE